MPHAQSGGSFAVQTLWSNNVSSSGGCVFSYVSATDQTQ